MVDNLKLYYSLPYFLKTIGASLHGLSLNHWRYGPETEKLVEEALEREHWSQDQWKIWQDERLGFLLGKAARDVPFYRDQWTERRKNGDMASWEILENWPILKKSSIRQSPSSFLVDRCEPDKMYIEHTSGTTGTPLTLYQSSNTLHHWYALYEARIRRWNKVNRNDCWAIIGGQLVTAIDRINPPFWVWNQAFHQLYLSAYHISSKNAQFYVNALCAHNIRYIVSYPSSITSLSTFILDQNLAVPELEAVISNAEPLFDYQREIIQKAFHCPVKNTYGMSELVGGGSECKNGEMHLWPEAGIIEIIDDVSDQPIPDRSTGKIIATGLINEEMPLIRYETGDRGSLKSGRCSCGCSLPLINNIEGRMDDMIITPDGRTVGRLDPVFKVDMPILEAQIIQETINTIRVKFIPGLGYNHDELLTQRLKERLGSMNFILEQVSSIPRGANGKFKAVVSDLKNH